MCSCEDEYRGTPGPPRHPASGADVLRDRRTAATGSRGRYHSPRADPPSQAPRVCGFSARLCPLQSRSRTTHHMSPSCCPCKPHPPPLAPPIPIPLSHWFCHLEIVMPTESTALPFGVGCLTQFPETPGPTPFMWSCVWCVARPHFIQPPACGGMWALTAG